MSRIVMVVLLLESNYISVDFYLCLLSLPLLQSHWSNSHSVLGAVLATAFLFWAVASDSLSYLLGWALTNVFDYARRWWFAITDLEILPQVLMMQCQKCGRVGRKWLSETWHPVFIMCREINLQWPLWRLFTIARCILDRISSEERERETLDKFKEKYDGCWKN
jgi:hypothetical protein